jgi:pimeloyl-ACP methyl ester carboxylesterase
MLRELKMLNKSNLKVAATSLGPIEYYERDRRVSSQDAVVVTIHGALGGYDQSDILGRTIGPAGYRYISISRPGYLGTPLKGRESPEAQADLIAALLDHLGIKSAVVFAVSGGGYSALHFGLRHAARCRGLVLCSTIGGINNVRVPFFAYTMMKFLARIPIVPGLLRKKVQGNIEGALKKTVSHPEMIERILNDPDTLALYKELALSTMTNMARRLSGTDNDLRITTSIEYPLKDIKVPTLVVHGDEDPTVNYSEHGKRLAEEIPGATLHLAERGEHVAIFTHREQVQKAVADFMGSLSIK